MTPVSMPKGTARSARGSRRGSPSPCNGYKYSLLIKPTSKFVSREEDFKAIQAGLLNLKKKLDISKITLEEGKHRCHFHAQFTFHRKSMYAKKYQQKGVYVGIKPIKSETAFDKYLLKERKLQDAFQQYAFNDTESSHSN